jgi:hypothetical protein
MNAHLYVSGASTQQRMAISAVEPGIKPEMFPFAVSSQEPKGSRLTREILTAKLNVNPEYQAALLDAESESWDEPGTDVRAMIEAANERRRAAQGQAR